MEIHDCKVRVSNVDSQESFNNLVVQVIGEMSNKAAAHRKFVQTFVLAEQPNGYYVLNDIFRYLNEDEEEEVEEQNVQEPEVSDVAVSETEPRTLTSSDDPALQQQDVDVVAKKLEEDVPEVKTEEPIAAALSINGKSGSETAGDEEVSTTSDPMDVDSVAVQKDETQPTAQVEAVPAEKPKDPEPTPVASPKSTTATPAPSTASMPAPAPKPAAPKTWANLVASRAPSTAASVPASTSSTSPAPPQTKLSQPQSNTTAASAPSSAEDTASQAQQGPGAGWQTAGQDNTRRQTRQQSNSISSGAAERGNILGYVKNVTEKVDAAELKSVLNQYGKLEYFDVSRQKVRLR